MRPTGRGMLLLALLLAGSVSGRADDLPEISTRGSLRVLVVPFTNDDEFFSLGSRPGFDHEIVEGFCQLQRVALKVVPIPSWDGLIPALRAGKGDLIAGSYSDTEARRKEIDFTVEVFPTRNVVVSLKPHKPVQSLEELRSERIGIVKGTSMGDVLSAAGIPRTAVDDAIPAGGLLAAMKQGKVSVGIMGVETAIAGQRVEPDLELGVFVGPPGRLAYGVRKDEVLLLKALDAYIENIRKTQTWARLVVKYFGERAPEVLRKARGE